MIIDLFSFCRKCDVINRGFSGYNTRWNKIILPRLVTSEMAPEIAAITIFLGANDSNNELNSKQMVPIDEYKQNMIEMVKYLLVSCFVRLNAKCILFKLIEYFLRTALLIPEKKAYNLKVPCNFSP